MLPLTQEEVLAYRLVMQTAEAIAETKKATMAVNEFSAAVKQAKALGLLPLNIDSTSVEKLSQKLNTLESSAGKATKSLWNMRNMARTALGTLEAMAIFLVTRFIAQAITKTIDSLKQMELALYKIGIAEKALSLSGLDITPQNLLDIATQVTQAYSYISKIDSLKMVSNLAMLAKGLDFTKEQILDLAIAIPILARNADVSIENATQQIINGISKHGKGLADLYVQVNDQIIQQEAINLGLVSSLEAYKNLTAEQQQQIDVTSLLSIVKKKANELSGDTATYLETEAGKIAEVTGLWETFTTKLGTTFAPAIKNGTDVIITGLKLLIIFLEVVKSDYINFMALVIAAGNTFNAVWYGQIRSVEDFGKVFEYSFNKAATAMRNYLDQIPTDTPTIPGLAVEDNILENQEDLAGALEKMNHEILEAQLKLEQDMEDAAIDLERKMSDISVEYKAKRLEAEKNYSSKVADINRDHANRIADINAKQAESNAKARQDELDREREFQNKLQEMKEDFLMDLEDALHARDARQILKLIKQYNLDKLQAQRKHDLDKKSSAEAEKLRQQSFANERAQAERDRKAKLAEAQRDYADKLAKLQADEDAERAAAQLKYEREKQDLEKAMHDRLEIVAANLIAEFNLTEARLGDIVGLYRRYYAEVTGIYMAMAAMFAGVGMMGTGLSTSQNDPRRGRSAGVIGMAGGGTIIANRPTTVLFGEAGIPEMATFTPIGKQGRDVNKVFSNMGGGSSSGAGGKVSIELLLSPDLESRIIRNTMNQTAEVIFRTTNSKGR